jgi:hypothetical protein
MIDGKHRLSITRQAQPLNLSRGSVYYLPRPVGTADLALMRRLDELHLEHPFMGAQVSRRQLQSEASRYRYGAQDGACWCRAEDTARNLHLQHERTHITPPH